MPIMEVYEMFLQDQPERLRLCHRESKEADF